MTNETINQDPDAIERDIRETQQQMSQTVDKIGDQLSIKNVFNALLDKADENGVDAHYLVEGARRNPIALGLIAAGAIWLISDKDSKLPSMPSRGKKPKAGTKDEFDLYGSDVHHRDYVTHMSGIEMREGEDPAAYQRRRDTHRANFLMCERGQDEDESSFRKRLDEMTDKFREKRRAWSGAAADTSGAAWRRTSELGSSTSSRAQELYGSNPLVGGIVAAAVGAAFGSAIPVSRQEQEKLGAIGEKAREIASEQKDQLTSKAMEKKDELLEKADEKLQSARGQQGNAPRQPESAVSGGGFPATAGSDRPFILTDRNN